MNVRVQHIMVSFRTNNHIHATPNIHARFSLATVSKHINFNLVCWLMLLVFFLDTSAESFSDEEKFATEFCTHKSFYELCFKMRIDVTFVAVSFMASL